jgi:hypothetical protein
LLGFAHATPPYKNWGSKNFLVSRDRDVGPASPGVL